MNTISFYRAVLLVLTAGAASACSSIHPYMNSAPENLTIKPDVRTGSARMHVYEIDNACNASYRGTVELNNLKVKVGIPVNKPSYLVFNFSDSSLFTGSSSVSYDLYLNPKTGYHYEAAVSYADSMYGATIHEQDSRGGARRETPRFVPKACAAK